MSIHATRAIRVITAAGLLATVASADESTTDERAMMSGRSGWSSSALVTVGESTGGYRLPGKLDGLGAYRKDDDTVRVLINHELSDDSAYKYGLASGAQLRGARVSYVDVDRRTREVCGAGLAYDTIYDRRGRVVEDGSQVNETFSVSGGLDRLCSGRLVLAGQRGFEDTIWFCGEETSADGSHPHGGSEWALDVASMSLR